MGVADAPPGGLDSLVRVLLVGLAAAGCGKEYEDNTWAQLAIGYLDLIDVRVSFETECARRHWTL